MSSISVVKVASVCVLCILCSALAAAQQKRTPASAFVGRVVYHVASEGTDSSRLELFRAFSPTSYKLFYGTKGRIRLTEEGGGAGVDILADLKKKRYYQLHHGERRARKLKRTSYEDAFPQILLAPEAGEETINGYPCVKFKVLNSAFVRRGAHAYVWITDSITVPKERGEYTGEEGYRAFFPLPLILGVESGTVMRLVVEEPGVTVTYTTEVTPGPVPNSTFSIPAGYALR